MADFVPVSTNFGFDAQITQRSSHAIDLVNVGTLYYRATLGEANVAIYTGAYFNHVTLTIASYNDDEYVFVGSTTGDYYTNITLYAVKTSITSQSGLYTIINSAKFGANDYVKHGIGTSATGKTYIIAESTCQINTNDRQCYPYRISAPPTTSPNTPGTLEQFSNINLNDYYGVGAYSNPIFFGGNVYVGTANLYKINPDAISSAYLAKSTMGIDFDGGNGRNGIFIAFDPIATGGYNSIYLFNNSNQYWRLKSTDLTSAITTPPYYVDSRSGGVGQFFWRGVSRGIAFKSAAHEFDRRLYSVVSNENITTYPGSPYGLVAFDNSLVPIASILQTDNPTNSGPAIANDGTIYYRAGNTLYAISDSGDNSYDGINSNGSLSIRDQSSILPDGGERHRASPIIDSEGRIIVVSSNTSSANNVHIFSDNGTRLSFIKSFRVPTTLSTTPSIGSSGLLYILGDNNVLYAYGIPRTPSTTTTTTTPSGPTTTTTTTPAGPTTTTTTTTGTGTTTTTTTQTTTPPPLAVVKTTLFVNGLPSDSSNASDSSATQNSLLAKSFSFGTVASNETSKTIVIALNAPYVKAIANIRLGLTSTGGINFSDGRFGIINSPELREDITPDNQFLGVNSTKDSGSMLNITIPNKDNHTSEYVYLNVKLPQDQIIGSGLIRYKWFFDYAD